MTSRRRRRLTRYDTRAPLSEPYASPELARWYAEQKQAATQSMRAHDGLPKKIRAVNALVGNDAIARRLFEAGYRKPADVEAKVRRLLELRR